MTGASTTREDVERLACLVYPPGVASDRELKEAAATLRALLDDRDAARARIEELSAEVERMRTHITDLHNRVRHEFSAEVEAATDKAFKAMAARAALAGAPREEIRGSVGRETEGFPND